MTTARIFTALALFRLLKGLLRALPDYITQFFQALVSLERLEKYFQMDEKKGLCVEVLAATDVLDREAQGARSRGNVGNILFKNCVYQWTQHGEEPGDKDDDAAALLTEVDANLSNESLKLSIPHLMITARQLVVVKGPVGSGKSSFCQAILGEMPRLADDASSRERAGPSEFQCCGRVAYAGQQAWIQSGRLRENILFGLPYEKEKYDRVVDACCLGQDFAELPEGDMTFIGKWLLSVLHLI